MRTKASAPGRYKYDAGGFCSGAILWNEQRQQAEISHSTLARQEAAAVLGTLGWEGKQAVKIEQKLGCFPN